jgi:hypothetical protein
LSAFNTQKNPYFNKEKNHTIFTPPTVCNWLYETLKPELNTVQTVFDPACGSGNLLRPFKEAGKVTVGCDIDDFGADCVDQFFRDDFLTWRGEFPKMDLCMLNPPFNHSVESRRKWGKTNLLPELFIQKCFDLFGKETKAVLFTPMGFRLNTRCYTEKQGGRYRNIRDNMGKISSIVSVPLDMFPNPDYDNSLPEQRRNVGKGIMKSNIKRKEIQQEIIFFNMPNLDPHYCLPDSVIEDLREMDREAWG